MLACVFVLLLLVLLVLTNCERLLVICRALCGQLGSTDLYNRIPGGSGTMFGGIFSGSGRDNSVYEWSRTDLGDDDDDEDDSGGDKEDDTLLAGNDRDRRSNSVSTATSSVTFVARHDHPAININSSNRTGPSDDDDVEAFYRDEPNAAKSSSNSRSTSGSSSGGGGKKSSKKGVPAPVDDVALLRQVNAGSGGGAAASRAGGRDQGQNGSRLASEKGKGPSADDVALLRAVNSGRAAAQPEKDRFVTKAPDGTPAASLAEVLRTGAGAKSTNSRGNDR